MLCAGQVYRSILTVKNQTGAPASVALAITKPDGTFVSPAPAPGAGSQVGADWVVTYDYTLPASGLFKFAWTTTGPGTAPVPDYVNVSAFASILSLADAREHLGTGPELDSRLPLFMAAATRITEDKVGTCVVRTFTGDWITGTSRDTIRLPHGPVPAGDSVTAIRSVYTGGPSWAAGDLTAYPDAGVVYLVSGRSFWGGPWTADYTAGRLVIGENIQAGCRQILWDLWGTQRGLTTDTDNPDLEQVTVIEAGYRLSPLAWEAFAGDLMPGFA
jgi:hypothetical protein